MVSNRVECYKRHDRGFKAIVDHSMPQHLVTVLVIAWQHMTPIERQMVVEEYFDEVAEDSSVQNRKRRFFYHYHRSTGGWTVHFAGRCIPCMEVKCLVGNTETKLNKRQPKGVVRGFCKAVTVRDNVAVIS